MNSPGSAGDDQIDIPGNLFGKSECLRPRSVHIAITHWGGDAHQRGIGTVQAQRVVNHVVLAPIFAGYYPPVRLVPVQNDSLIEILTDHIKVDGDLMAIVQRKLIYFRNHRLPSRAGKAVLWGVYGWSRTPGCGLIK